MAEYSISSTFYRLEKENREEDGWLDVYEFHTVYNTGRTYYRHFEEHDGRMCWSDKPKFVDKERGNKKYKRLKSIGYKFAGRFSMNTIGEKFPI